ncbi:Phytocyanin domain containing protein [Trema orientale]|uniref:Phytocyanin domain containing protein n=1 Tax=Trema orientale TaxID=63057 RepID=A0A2P5FNM2_TREOI|nr:Phytocyanin domain containing protein [Trema orientale]
MAFFKIVIPLLGMVFLFLTYSEAKEIFVGGKENSWTIPSNSSNQTLGLEQWAKETKFEYGDILIFKFNPKKDSVLEVSEKNYNSCNRSKPIERYRNKKTVIELDRCTPFYFISGAKGHCEKGQRLLVNVACEKHIVETLALVPALAPKPDEPPAHNGAPGLMKLGFAMGIIGLVGIPVM